MFPISLKASTTFWTSSRSPKYLGIPQIPTESREKVYDDVARGDIY